jgi:site-specific DNA-methyltransferase (adenine-specific)
MNIILDHDRATILHGDCRDLLNVLGENSVDAIICDPPYLLANASGTGFMGREWDSVKLEPGETIGTASERWHRTWCEIALKVLKPGGHMLAFGGSRTFHRMCSAIEDVGFELRDVLIWMYGQGFPKSLDISKAIDAKLGATREVINEATDRRGDGTGYGLGHSGRITSGIAVTPEAAAWTGWGTALKPAYEPIALARKPPGGTIVSCVMEHGTGGINIGACRVGDEERYNPPARNNTGDVYELGIGKNSEGGGSIAVGRWPANVMMDEEVGAQLDAQSGITKDGVAGRGRGFQRGGYVGGSVEKEVEPGFGYGGEGGASRFFYCPKPSRAEKEAGLDHLPAHQGGEVTGREEGSAGLNSPRAGAGRRGGVKNTHVTIKPVKLMRYLCRLITPPGGIVLDMFAGSGTTGVAALTEGFNFIGSELGGDDGSHLPILLGRIRHTLGLEAVMGTEPPASAY